MKILFNFKSFIVLAAASLAAGILIVLPIVVGAQPSSTPTGGNVDATFNTVTSGTYFDGDNASYFLDPASPTTSLVTAGKVGVGTTTPQEQLDVQGAVRSMQLQIPNSSSLLGYELGGEISFPTGDVKIQSRTGKDIIFGNGGADENMRILANGNVGIGTTAPSSMLNIVTGIGNALLRLEGTGVFGGGLFFTYKGLLEGYEIRSDDPGGLNIEASGWSKISFDTNSSEKMRIAPNGNVGIGTTSPGEKLEVVGNIESTANLILPTTTSTTGIIYKGANRFLHNYGTSSYNTFLGIDSGNFSMVTAVANVGLGDFTLQSLSSGDFNTAVGYGALTTNTTGASNTAVGRFPLRFNRTGSNNVAIGPNALASNIDGWGNVAIGFQSQDASASADYNVSMGWESMGVNSTGTNNVAIGTSTLRFGTTITANTAVGSGALENNTANNNTAVGADSLRANTSGYNNTAVGSKSLTVNSTGYGNTAVGYVSLQDNNSGYNNTAVGDQALSNNTTGYYNTASGYQSMINNQGAGNYNTGYGAVSLYTNSTGDTNTAVGYAAGYSTRGSGNVFLGNFAGFSETGSNTLYIDNNSTSTPLIFGNFNDDYVVINGTFGVLDEPNGVISTFGVGGIGMTARGNGGGGVFSDADSTAEAHVSNNNVGISAYGSSHGGYFGDNVDLALVRGSAYIGGRDSAAKYYGIRAFGDDYAGYFENNNYSGNAKLADGHTGIIAYGNSQGGWFEDTNSGGIYAKVGYSSYGIYSNGYIRGSKIYGPSYIPSDARLKDIKGAYNKGLDEIMELNSIEFNYKKDNPRDVSSDEDFVGFTAQEVQKIFPEAVTEDEDGYLNLKMQTISVATVNAIQELKVENDALKEVVCELKPEAEICN